VHHARAAAAAVVATGGGKIVGVEDAQLCSGGETQREGLDFIVCGAKDRTVRVLANGLPRSQVS